MLDASATLSWLIEDERDKLAVKMARHVQEVGAIVPPLWRYEMQNALLSASRHGRITDVQANELLSHLAALGISIAPPPQTLAAETPFARRFGLTIYDAAYVELAVRENAPVMSRDAKIRAAAADLGLLWEPE